MVVFNAGGCSCCWLEVVVVVALVVGAMLPEVVEIEIEVEEEEVVAEVAEVAASMLADVFCFFQPNNGGNDTAAENIHTPAIIRAPLFGVRFFK